jgi:hypothetical protein
VIDEGASWPEAPSTSSAPAEIKKHWAFIPPKRPAEPAVKTASWALNPIDKFILAKLEAEKLTPSLPADKATLLRRASLDLIGLRPRSRNSMRFLNDKSPNAYEKQIDRLLASPHYGERWGASGSMGPATRTRMVLKRTSPAASGFIAIGSSTR